ncbi:uncharacterized protein [Branchiostoma lanceolatum]|uniref:uncharacterized protein isoform X2 n=1 Tax=Branchiostoma lanceolatum TaxID=7740 RepID=UPI00345188A3
MKRSICDNMTEVTGDGAHCMDDKDNIKRARREDIPGNSGSSEDADRRSIHVSNIPDGVNRDKLEIHFMRKSNGGCDIESVTMIDPLTAKITYPSVSAADRVLNKDHVLLGVKVRVMRWTDMKKTPPPPFSFESIQVFSSVRATVNANACGYISNQWFAEVEKNIPDVKIQKDQKKKVIEVCGLWDPVRKARSLLQIEAKVANDKAGSAPGTCGVGLKQNQTESDDHVHMESGATSGGAKVMTGQRSKPGNADKKSDSLGMASAQSQLKSNASHRHSSSQTEDSDRIVVDRDIMSYVTQVHGAKLLEIIQKNKAVIVPNDGITEVQIYGSSSTESNPYNAVEEFTNLYQNTHHTIVCKTLPHAMNIPSADVSNAIGKITEDFPRVMVKTSADKGVVFYGTEKEAQDAKTAMCQHLGMSTTRGRRRRGMDGTTGLPSKGVTGNHGTSSISESFSHTTREGIQIVVAHGNITQQPVDVIANAANETLDHGGGVAGAISKAGGPSVQRESKDYVRTRGPLCVTGTAVTSGGKLPCKNIIHAVGPRWIRGHEDANERELRQTCYNILTKASATLKAQSVAIPAISSGIFGMPKQKCADSLLSGLLEFLQRAKFPSCTLRKIIFIDMDQATVKVLADTFNNKLSLSVSPSTTGTAASSDGRVSRPPSDQYSPSTEDSTASRKSHTGQGDTGKGLTSDGDDAADDCSICMSDITDPKSLPCKHTFCRECIDKALSYKSQCPMCNTIVGELKGDQPPGRMEWEIYRWTRLPGYEKYGAIVVNYYFPSGTQGPDHPNPGRYFSGTSRRAYLPNNEEGRELAQLLKRAFDNRLVFTIGTSVTTGATDTVIWNDIHHKTKVTGGASDYGYPDPGYLTRLREELAAKGIK